MRSCCAFVCAQAFFALPPSLGFRETRTKDAKRLAVDIRTAPPSGCRSDFRFRFSFLSLFVVCIVCLNLSMPYKQQKSRTRFVGRSRNAIVLVFHRNSPSTEHSNLFEAYATANNGVLEYVQELDVDSAGFFAMSFLSQHLKDVRRKQTGRRIVFAHTVFHVSWTLNWSHPMEALLI
jgi:hypothetical protein